MTIKPWRMEYALGYLAETGVWVAMDGYSHPWESEMQKVLDEHADDPDWEGVTILCRPIIPWMPASNLEANR